MTTCSRIRLLPPSSWLLLLLLPLQQPTWGFVPALRQRMGSRSALGSTARSTAAAAQPAPPDVHYRAPDDVPVWEVPLSIRREAQGEPPASRIQFLSLEALFPGADGRRLAEAFDSDERFRRAIRVAMRDDLFVPDSTRSAKVNAFLKDLGSSLHVSWERSATNYGNLTQVLRDQGIQEIDGRAFIKTLGGLAGGGARVKGEDGFEVHEKRFGSLIDIVNPGNRLKPAHSWHLDANLPQTTVMFGFPRANNYRGAGVFSHAVQLSHQLRDQVPGGGQVVQYDEYDIVRSGELLPTFPEENIIRPWFQRGSEVMVYDDTWSIHSAPDHIHREAVWRFM